MRARLAGITAENAVAAVIAAEICQGDEDLAGIGNDVRLETLLGCQGRGKQSRKFVIRTAKKLAGAIARERQPVAQFVEICR